MTDQELTILAILSETERYGYEIDKIISDRKLQYSGGIALSSIYAVLNRLSNKGLLTSREVVRSGRPPRKLFAISYSGRQELQVSLAAALTPQDRVLGHFELILLIWAQLSDDRRKELLSIYHNWLTAKGAELSELFSAEINPVSGAFIERPLTIIKAELDWLTRFSEKNGIRLDIADN